MWASVQQILQVQLQLGWHIQLEFASVESVSLLIFCLESFALWAFCCGYHLLLQSNILSNYGTAQLCWLTLVYCSIRLMFMVLCCFILMNKKSIFTIINITFVFVDHVEITKCFHNNWTLWFCVNMVWWIWSVHTLTIPWLKNKHHSSNAQEHKQYFCRPNPFFSTQPKNEESRQKIEGWTCALCCSN